MLIITFFQIFSIFITQKKKDSNNITSHISNSFILNYEAEIA